MASRCGAFLDSVGDRRRGVYMATIIGIDPGLSGGVCAFGKDRFEAYAFTTMADVAFLFAGLLIKNKISDIKAYIEEPPVFFQGAGGGLASQAKLHRNLGQYEGLLMGLGIPFETVSPKKWQKGLPGLAKLKGVERKRALKNLAVQRYPQLKPTLKTCDAILIAEYGLKNSQ